VCVSIHICQQPNRTDLLHENHYPATLLGFPDLAAACASLLCTMHSMFSQSLQRIYTDGVKALQRAAKASIIVCIVCMLFLAGVLFLYRSTDQVTVQASTACKRVDRALVSQAAVATMLLLLLLLLSQAISPRLTHCGKTGSIQLGINLYTTNLCMPLVNSSCKTLQVLVYLEHIHA
jgi:hypothetical protein